MGFQTSLTEGHIGHDTTVRGPDILRNVIVSGYVTFYQIEKCLQIYIFLLLTKWLHGSDEVALQAGLNGFANWILLMRDSLETLI